MASTAKKTNGNNGTEAPATTGAPATKAQMPKGMQKPASSVEQFWHEESGPIYGMLVGGKNYINKASRKINVIYIFRIVAECRVESNKGEMFEMPAPIGAIVGVWGSPGMRDLKQLSGCKVWMQRDGVKDVGQPSPMKVYEIGYEGTPKELVVAPVGHNLEGEQAGDRANEAAQSEDAIPF